MASQDLGSVAGTGLRAQVRAALERPFFKNLILAVIILNALTLGLSTSETVMAHAGGLMAAVDRIAVALFVVELLAKIFAYGLVFFRSSWNLFDAGVIVVGLLPQTNSLTALRALRVIRALRLLSVVPQMRAVVQALIDAMPGMGAVILMLSVVYYVASVMATMMFGAAFPDYFGTLGRSLFSLFQIMTLEAWADGIVRPVMAVYPYAWLFFVPFIVVTAFSVLNLFIGLLVNTMQAAVEAEAEEELEDIRETIREQMQGLADEVRALRRELETRGGRDG